MIFLILKFALHGKIKPECFENNLQINGFWFVLQSNQIICDDFVLITFAFIRNDSDNSASETASSSSMASSSSSVVANDNLQSSSDAETTATMLDSVLRESEPTNPGID